MTYFGLAMVNHVYKSVADGSKGMVCCCFCSYVFSNGLYCIITCSTAPDAASGACGGGCFWDAWT